MTQTQEVRGVATSIRTEGDITYVNYHGTDVVAFNRDTGRIVLDHGGWLTVTTKTRMNQASNQFGLGFQVYQENFEWFVAIDGIDAPYDDFVYAREDYGSARIIRMGRC